MTTVLKLGGSIITDKDTPETVDRETLDSVAETIGSAVSGERENRLVVVHGGGSFGHHHASRHGVSTTTGTHDATALREIHDAMTTLSDAVVDSLSERGVDTLPVRPLSVAHRDGEGELHLPAGQVETMLSEGFVPLLHGDVVTHAGKGATVLSGDDIVVSLARSLNADRVGLCSTVPGVLDENDEVISEIASFETVADALGESASTDVTGGMAGKVRTLLELDVPASIFDPSALSSFLAGQSPGTVIHRRTERS